MAETIADYLVNLGFKIDKGEEARFSAALDNLGKTVLAISDTAHTRLIWHYSNQVQRGIRTQHASW